MVDLSENEPKIASKFDLIITLLETFFSLTIDNSHEIMDMLKRNKESMMMALSKGLDSSLLLNKLKSIRLFKILSVNSYFSAEEVKAIMTVVRTEYRSHVAHQEFMGDVQSELKEICNFFPYETHECFWQDIELQYEDFKNWRMIEEEDKNMESDDPYKAHELYKIKSSLGIGVHMFLNEMEAFCRTKECINDILYLCASDFYTNLYIDNERHHMWTKEYLDCACRLIDDVKLGQVETDQVVEKMMEKIFVESKRIFETSTDPVFMPKEFAEPFYHLLRQSIKALSREKAEILLGEMIKFFMVFQPEFETRVKCYDKICNHKSYYWMNMSLFKIFKYLLKYKEISIYESDLFYSIFTFLDMISLNNINTPALNNLRKEANKSITIIINKCTYWIPELDELLDSSINKCLELMQEKPKELTNKQESSVAKAFAIIKGLSIKGSPRSYKAIQAIISLLKDTNEVMRECISKFWPSLFVPNDLSRKNNFNISPFYKQRLFSIAFPALMKSYRESKSSIERGKNEGLPMVFVSKLIIPICSESSYELYHDYMDELLPLMVYSLSMNDDKIKEICLKMIKKLLEQENQKGLNIEDLTQNLINCIHKDMNLFVKNLALICMDLILNCGNPRILLYKKTLLSKVKLFLDDKKRSTRKLAVKCYNDWSIA
jgi:hypothetical protein